MAELSFSIEATTRGAGSDREGVVRIGGQELRYSAPADMGGKGVGASPETLLIGAVTACYSLTLLAYLEKRRLAHSDIAIETQGFVSAVPGHDKYERIVVNPTIRGGDPEQYQEYRAMADRARERCFIGQTVAAGGVVYELGKVTVE